MILAHEANGPGARFQRYMADMAYVIATGQKADEDKTPRFADIVEKIYKNPFEKQEKKPRTAAEIKQHIIDKIDELLDGG